MNYLIRDAIKHYEVLQDLFELDPLLIPVFVHVCPKEERKDIFKYIPPSVSTAYIAHLVSIERWTKAEVSITFCWCTDFDILISPHRWRNIQHFLISSDKQ